MTPDKSETSRRGTIDPDRHLDDIEWQLRLDGLELTPDRLRHLDGCLRCAAEDREWAVMGRALRTLPSLELPPGLSTRISARLSGSGVEAGGIAGLPHWLIWWGRPLGLLAAAMLLLMTIVTTQYLSPNTEEWSSEGAWLVGLPSQDDPLASEWNRDAGLMGSDAGPWSLRGADVSGSGHATGTGS